MTHDNTLLIRGARLADGGPEAVCDILVQGGIITAVKNAPRLEQKDSGGRGLSVDGASVEAGGLTCLPAFCDLHAHFRDPGMTNKEDLASGSRAAVRGGYTAVNLMANTKPVISTHAQVKDVLARAKRIGLVDVHQCVSITRDMDGRTVDHLEGLGKHVRIISEDGHDVMNARVMLQAMTAAARLGLTVMCHCEDMNLSPVDYRLAEDLMTQRNIQLARVAGCRLHIAHVSTEGSMRAVIAAKQAGQAVTCEVTPHHLALTDETRFRVNPPLRTQQDVDFLIHAVKEGWVDAIATDHAPHTPEDKAAGAPGMVGLETAFGVCFTTLVQPGHITLAQLSKLMSANPARMLGMHKGRIEPGCDGDLALVDLTAPWTVDAGAFASKGRNTPFDGTTLYGRVITTIKAGRVVYHDESTAQEEHT
ncbi:MAG: dihydroorotase [Candidatus Cryosericum sp.]